MLMQATGEFLHDNHNPLDKVDNQILYEWRKFKALIMKKPDDIKKLQNYLEQLKFKKYNNIVQK